jgi:hypothetical protein
MGCNAQLPQLLCGLFWCINVCGVGERVGRVPRCSTPVVPVRTCHDGRYGEGEWVEPSITHEMQQVLESLLFCKPQGTIATFGWVGGVPEICTLLEVTLLQASA